MLKKNFDIIVGIFQDWLYNKYEQFLTGRRFGQKQPALNEAESFLQLELLLKIQQANKYRNPNGFLRMPAFLTKEEFDQLISIIKTKLK